MKFTELAAERADILEDLRRRLDIDLTCASQTCRQAAKMRYETSQNPAVSPFFFVPPEGNNTKEKMDASEAYAQKFSSEWSPVKAAVNALINGIPTKEHYLTLATMSASNLDTYFHRSIKSLMAGVEPFDPPIPEPVKPDLSYLDALYEQNPNYDPCM